MTYAIISTGFENNSICENEHEKQCIMIKKILRECIWGAFTNGIDSFFLNCEKMIPLWAAEIVCAMKKYNNIKLNIIVPFEEQCLNWNEELRNRYYSVHSQADSVIFIEKQYNENCYLKSHEMMISRCDGILIFEQAFNTETISFHTEKHKKSVYHIKIKI